MSKQASAKGLKDQECNRGKCIQHPPIPYVPVIDKIQDTPALKKEYYETFTVPDRTKFKVHTWDASMPKEFLNHVMEALNACEHLGNFSDYKQAYLKQEKASYNTQKLEENLQTLKEEGVGKYVIEGKQEKLKSFLKESTSAKKKREEATETSSLCMQTPSPLKHASSGTRSLQNRLEQPCGQTSRVASAQK